MSLYRIDLNATNELGAVLVSEQIKAGVLADVPDPRQQSAGDLVGPANVLNGHTGSVEQQVRDVVWAWLSEFGGER